MKPASSNSNYRESSGNPGMEEESSLLGRIYSPSDMKTLGDDQLKRLCHELRQETISAISKTGGHLGASLGVVELTVAIHAVFNTPEDRLIWDVGHQCYPHKILTGRRQAIHTIRKGGGISGFTKRQESIYDPFGAGHSSTSISAGLGMATARDLDTDNEKDNDVICVIGDGSISAGMAYEAMNNAGAMKRRMIVILNDNNMSIAPPVGAMSKYLTRLVSSKPYIGARDTAKKITEILPPTLKRVAARAEETARSALGGGTLFEDMGFYYIGPIDGHNLDHLLPVLRNLRDNKTDKPVLVHVITKKGKGYAPAETASDKMHGVTKFDIVTGNQYKPKSSIPSYTSVFAKTLTKHAAKDKKIVAITAAMPEGTGLDVFEKSFPKRMFDVGIAEQHAVTFAAGMATEGFKPFVAIYSTFLQRSYDQIVHDVALQNLPVRFAIDRAGLVGADGQTHAGSFDTAFLGCVPNMVLMAPSDEAELAAMVTTAAMHDSSPIAFRYPRGKGTGAEIPDTSEPMEIGKGRILQEGEDIAIISYGTRLGNAIDAAHILQETKNLTTTIVDARFAKPLDGDLIKNIARNHHKIITIEEGSIGGFGSFVLDFLANEGLLDNGKMKIRTMHLPDIFQDHDEMEKQYKQAGLHAGNIARTAISM